MDELCNQTLDILVEEFQKPENRKKIQDNILDPIIKYIGKEIWPYVLISSALLSILIIILFTMIYILMKQLRNNSFQKM